MAAELQAKDLTGGVVYGHLRNLAGAVWNGSAFVAWNVANWATYALALTEQTGSGFFTANMPAGLAAGIYSVNYYRQAGASPAQGDFELPAVWFEWNGLSVAGFTTPQPELTAVPAATPAPWQALQLLYQALRNPRPSTASADKVTTDAGATVGTATVSFDGTTFTRSKMT